MPQHPVQPLVFDESDCVRFRENKIVSFLLREGPFDLNQLARMDFSIEDREQLEQLIGSSLSRFGGLSHVSKATYERAAAQLPPDTTPHSLRVLQELEESIKNHAGAPRFFPREW